MKELSIKQKAQRYDEAIERARKIKNGEPINVPDGTPIPIAIFPELKESGDERIWIINYLNNRILNSTIIAEKENLKKAIAWLEKQGEQMPADKKGMNLVEEEMTPFQKKVFCIIDTAIEEEQGLKQVCDELLRLAHNEIMIKQKSAWSVEDESHIRYLIECLEHCKKGVALTMTTSTSQEYINWLKSLKPQNTWKPSEEQLIQLSNASNGLYYNCETLLSLLEQLKKLREE